MPIYEYQCKVCNHQLEALQKFSDQPLIECPACKQKTLEKLVSAAGFQLKGSGWYATDYKAKPKPANEGDSGNASSSGSETGSASDKSAASS